MTEQKEKGALALACALRRYSEMKKPAEAYAALHADWLPAIANIIDPVLWGEVPVQSEKQIVRDLKALNKRAYEKSAAVTNFMKKGQSAQKAVDKVIAAHSRNSRVLESLDDNPTLLRPPI